jgi:isoaspartyl peptidase/L-asparaginase-like protein (Ntn-hydrolase superfamily)
MPNAEGKLQLDAIICDGPRHEIGCVMGVEGFRSVIGIARKVMERSRHCVLIGEGNKNIYVGENRDI